ncbi:MAG: hypothetical protein IJ229_02655 [Clostridia bacterium]|nr:hypothetical protein [Clostridia bacterium]
MRKHLTALLLVLLLVCLCAFALADTLQSPTDFTLDPVTGTYSFQAVDENAGYYFIRIYPVVGGTEGDRYVASSKRINAKTGEKKGKLDVSGMGWGQYNVKLITFPASGTDFEAPDAQVLTVLSGVGGVLERPELRVVADGNTAFLLVDWLSCADYYAFQYLPEVTFTVYSDEALTQAVTEVSYDLSVLPSTMDNHPAGGYIWNFQMGGTYACDLDNVELLPNVTLTLDPGTYYATVQAVSNDPENIASSQPSEAVAFTLTEDAPNGEYTFATTSLWANPNIMGVPCAIPGSAQGRVDAAQGQETTSVVK